MDADTRKADWTASRVSASTARHLGERGERPPAVPDDLEHYGIGAWPTSFEEHCCECGAPACFATCALFRPEPAGKCRRFRFGIEMSQWEHSPSGGVVDLVYDEWALLKMKARGFGGGPWRLGFLLQIDVVGPSDAVFAAVLAITTTPFSHASPSFRLRMSLRSGLTEVFVPPDDLAFLQGQPNLEGALMFDEGAKPALVRVFTAHFVEAVGHRRERVAPKKILFVDLDYTLWWGTVDEDERIELRPHALEALAALRKRKVAIHALSRASRQKAWAAGEELGLNTVIDGWHCDLISKAGCIVKTVAAAGLLLEEVAVLDDDPAERNMIRAQCPAVTVLTPGPFALLPWHPAFYSTLTETTDSSDSPDAAASHVQINENMQEELVYRAPLENEIQRCWELAQRANRMQCVEWRPTYAEMIQRAQERSSILRVGLCSDRFAEYGLTCVAALRVETNAIHLQGLVFSCRVGFRKFPQIFLASLIAETSSMNLELRIDGCPGNYASSVALEFYEYLCRMVRTPDPKSDAERG